MTKIDLGTPSCPTGHAHCPILVEIGLLIRISDFQIFYTLDPHNFGHLTILGEWPKSIWALLLIVIDILAYYANLFQLFNRQVGQEGRARDQTGLLGIRWRNIRQNVEEN